MLAPVIKWAGGKRQLLDKLIDLMPNNYHHYFEPFVGGGALLLAVHPKNANINDFNEELCIMYQVIKDDVMFHDLLSDLDAHEKNHSEKYYYNLRQIDKDEEYKELSWSKRAARTIYLNKAGYNGLYRVNSKGYFNVPFGHKDKVKTYNKEIMNDVHHYLKVNDVTITNHDFEEAVQSVKKGDFVYFDPPYDKWKDDSSFTSYTKNDFDRNDQKRLYQTFKRLSDLGAYVMLSNHNTDFIRSLYKDYHIHVVSATRMVNSDATKRGPVEEVIITNYEK